MNNDPQASWKSRREFLRGLAHMAIVPYHWDRFFADPSQSVAAILPKIAQATRGNSLPTIEMSPVVHTGKNSGLELVAKTINNLMPDAAKYSIWSSRHALEDERHVIYKRLFDAISAVSHCRPQHRLLKAIWDTLDAFLSIYRRRGSLDTIVLLQVTPFSPSQTHLAKYCHNAAVGQELFAADSRNWQSIGYVPGSKIFEPSHPIEPRNFVKGEPTALCTGGVKKRKGRQADEFVMPMDHWMVSESDRKTRSGSACAFEVREYRRQASLNGPQNFRTTEQRMMLRDVDAVYEDFEPLRIFRDDEVYIGTTDIRLQTTVFLGHQSYSDCTEVRSLSLTMSSLDHHLLEAFTTATRLRDLVWADPGFAETAFAGSRVA